MADKLVTIRGDGIIPVINCLADQHRIRVPEREVKVIRDLGWDVEEHDESVAEAIAEADHLLSAAPDEAPAEPVTEEQAPVEEPAEQALVEEPAPEQAPVEPVTEEPAPEQAPVEEPAADQAASKAIVDADGVPLTAEILATVNTKAEAVQLSERFKIDMGWPEGVDPHNKKHLEQFKLADMKSVLQEALDASLA